MTTRSLFPALLREKIEESHSILDGVLEEHNPSHVFSLFSGGNDSSVLAHLFRERADSAVFVDTGTALPGVREFVDTYAAWFDVPMKVYEAGQEFEEMVLGRPEFWKAYSERYRLGWISVQDFILEERAKPGKGVAPGQPLGFPGPGGHRFPYIRLKERQIDRLVREHKTHRSDRIVLLTGVRLSESSRRMGNVTPVERRGAKVWVSPILNWTAGDMRAYRGYYELPQSDVAAMIHRSGECNCGSFAQPDERAMLASLYPEWNVWIESIERRAIDLGIPAATWGVRPPGKRRNTFAPGLMCVGCESERAA